MLVNFHTFLNFYKVACVQNLSEQGSFFVKLHVLDFVQENPLLLQKDVFLPLKHSDALIIAFILLDSLVSLFNFLLCPLLTRVKHAKALLFNLPPVFEGRLRLGFLNFNHFSVVRITHVKSVVSILKNFFLCSSVLLESNFIEVLPRQDGFESEVN